MGLTELLQKIGDENVQVQMLDNSTVSVEDKNRTNDVEVTFATHNTNCNEFYTGKGKVGLVVWIDREDWNKAIKK